MNTLFWIIVITSIVNIFAASYFVNLRNDYLRGFICLSIALLLINFGWLALIASEL